MDIDARYQKALARCKEIESIISNVCNDKFTVLCRKKWNNKNSNVFHLMDLNMHLIK